MLSRRALLLAATATLLLTGCYGGPCSDDPSDHSCEDGGGSGPTYTPPPATPTPTPTDLFTTTGANAASANGQVVVAWVTEGYGNSRTVFCASALVSSGTFSISSPGAVLTAGLDYDVQWLVNNDGNDYYDADHAEKVYDDFFTATTGSNLQTLDLATAIPETAPPAWANGQACP